MKTSESRKVTLSLQGRDQEIFADLWRLWLERDPESGPPMRVRIDPDAPVAWRELDKLRDLVELEYQGTQPSVSAYVTGRKGLRTLRWIQHEQPRIDLARSSLTELVIDAKKPLTVKIPRTLTTLRLLHVAAWNKLAVESDDDGARLSLAIWAPKKRPRAIAGLTALRALAIGATREVDLSIATKYPALEALEISGDERGVAVTNLQKLATLRRLATLSIDNAFHTDFSRLPSPADLPALRSLAIDGVRAAGAATLRERYRGFEGLSIRGVRTDAWLRANADNPFRAWTEEYGAALGRRATRAYRKAHAAIDGRKPTRKQAEAILRAFVADFNVVEAQIDTIMCEEIDSAFGAVARRLADQVSPAQATKWFDTWRAF